MKEPITDKGEKNPGPPKRVKHSGSPPAQQQVRTARRETILQIIPAQGWLAIYKANEGDTTEYVRLICWALVEDRHGAVVSQKPMGMMATEDGSTIFAEDMANFLYYEHETMVEVRE